MLPNSRQGLNVARQFNHFEEMQGQERPVGQKSTFDLSHDYKTSFKMGWLIPFLCEETYPNEDWNCSNQVDLQFSPLILPIMHRVNVETMYFYVPNRILWDGWEDFITGKDTATLPPHVLFGGFSDTWENSYLGNYFGLPQVQLTNWTDSDIAINAFPFAGYRKIWDEYFRRPQVQDEIFFPLIAGSNAGLASSVNALPLQKNWNMDYFTSALPEPQAGEEILIPLISEDLSDVAWVPTQTGTEFGPSQWKQFDGSLGLIENLQFQAAGGGHRLTGGPSGNEYYLDIQQTAATLAELREAVRLQEFMEKLNRTSFRYPEMIKGFFGVDPMRGTIQDPVFLGMSQGQVSVADVLQTAETRSNSSDAVIAPLGSYAGYARFQDAGSTISYSTEEHGFIFGLICVSPRSSYGVTGLERKWWDRQTYLDYAWKEFAEIGDEAIQDQELFLDATDLSIRDDVFGYTGRYNHLRYRNDYYTGQMGSDFADQHLGREFGNAPALNTAFLRCEPRVEDVFQGIADNGDHEIRAHIWNNVVVSRGLPKFGIPQM